MTKIKRYEVSLGKCMPTVNVPMHHGAHVLSARVEYIGSDTILYAVVLRALVDDEKGLDSRRVHFVEDGVIAASVTLPLAQFVGTVSHNDWVRNVFVDP